MKELSEQRLERMQRTGLIIGFTAVFFAGTTLIIERDKLKEAVKRSFIIEQKDERSAQVTLVPLSPEIPICE